MDLISQIDDAIRVLNSEWISDTQRMCKCAKLLQQNKQSNRRIDFVFFVGIIERIEDEKRSNITKFTNV